MHERRYTVRFICDRGISHEFVRHRVFSFSQESTRYCNYSKDKFNNSLTFIIPTWYTESWRIVGKGLKNSDDFEKYKKERSKIEKFDMYLADVEDLYVDLLNEGCKPQEARQVLPNAIKTELIMTGFTNQWECFFELRDDKKAHPDAYKLAHNLHNEFIKRNYVYGEANSKE